MKRYMEVSIQFCKKELNNIYYQTSSDDFEASGLLPIIKKTNNEIL